MHVYKGGSRYHVCRVSNIGTLLKGDAWSQQNLLLAHVCRFSIVVIVIACMWRCPYTWARNLSVLRFVKKSSSQDESSNVT